MYTSKCVYAREYHPYVSNLHSQHCQSRRNCCFSAGEELQPDSGVSGPFPSHPHHLPHLSILPQVLESPDVERGDDNLQGRDSAASLNLTCVQ